MISDDDIGRMAANPGSLREFARAVEMAAFEQVLQAIRAERDRHPKGSEVAAGVVLALDAVGELLPPEAPINAPRIDVADLRAKAMARAAGAGETAPITNPKKDQRR